jgi:hypothetical protein
MAYARVFQSGNSQAIRLPEEFRFKTGDARAEYTLYRMHFLSFSIILHRVSLSYLKITNQ